MIFHTRRWIKPEDLNPNGALFGGTLLRWLDEEAAIYAYGQLENSRLVTKYISAIDFRSSVKLGDVIELGVMVREFGRTSVTLSCEVRNKITGEPVLTIDKIVFVNLGEDGKPAPHGRCEVTETRMVYRRPEDEQESDGAQVTARSAPARPPVARPPVSPVGGSAT